MSLPTTRRDLRRIESQRGVALLMALIAVFLLIIITFEIEQTVRIENFITSNVEVDTKLEMAARSGLEVAIAKLRQDRQETEIDSKYDEWFPLFLHQELVEVDAGDEEFLASSEQSASRALTAEQSAQTVLTIKIFDENAKFNIYLLFNEDPNIAKKRVEQFANVLDRYRENLAGDLSYNEGARIAEIVQQFLKRSQEQPFGEAPVPPVKGRGTLTDISELLYCQAITPAMLWDGLDKDGVTVLPGLHRFITIWSDMQININTAETAGLAGIFGSAEIFLADRIEEYRKEVDEERERDLDADGEPRAKKRKDKSKSRSDAGLGESIQDSRQEDDTTGGAPFEQAGDIREKVEGMTQEIYNQISSFITVQSNVFSIFVTAKRGLVSRTKMFIVRRTEQGPRVLLEKPVFFPYFVDPKEYETATNASLDE